VRFTQLGDGLVQSREAEFDVNGVRYLTGTYQ
jgi:hypothetical protein